jgi:sugar phosphate isomerase/epimerase
MGGRAGWQGSVAWRSTVQLGLLTASLPQLTLDAIARWAGSQGFATLEVAAWPADDRRPLNPAHVDVRALTSRRSDEIRDQIDEAGVSMSALACYANNLHADRAERARTHDHLKAVVEAAAMLGVQRVGTFVGRDVSRSVADDLRQAETVFPALVEHASAHGVRLAIENCLMTGWHPDHYPANMAYSPELWEWMAGLGLRLNFDPSHLVGVGLDPVTSAATAAPYMDYMQAKDVEVLPGRIDRYGFLGSVVDRELDADHPAHSWWRYRLPGLGQIDWAGVLGALRSAGYNGVVSVEHEDPEHSGSVEAVQRGLLLARDVLAPLVA